MKKTKNIFLLLSTWDFPSSLHWKHSLFLIASVFFLCSKKVPFPILSQGFCLTIHDLRRKWNASKERRSYEEIEGKGEVRKRSGREAKRSERRRNGREEKNRHSSPREKGMEMMVHVLVLGSGEKDEESSLFLPPLSFKCPESWRKKCVKNEKRLQMGWSHRKWVQWMYLKMHIQLQLVCLCLSAVHVQLNNFLSIRLDPINCESRDKFLLILLLFFQRTSFLSFPFF